MISRSSKRDVPDAAGGPPEIGLPDLPGEMTPDWLARETGYAKHELDANAQRLAMPATERARHLAGELTEKDRATRGHRFERFTKGELVDIRGPASVFQLDERTNEPDPPGGYRPRRGPLLESLTRAHPHTLKRGRTVSTEALQRERTCLACLERFVTRNATQVTCSGACKKRVERHNLAVPDAREAARLRVIDLWAEENASAALRWFGPNELAWYARNVRAVPVARRHASPA
jgi:hypothetical protein